jgi:hypothetical protein
MKAAWNNGSGGDFSDTADWSTGTIPGAVDTAAISASGIYTVTTSANETVHALTTAAGATLDITGGIFTMTAGTGTGVNAGTIEIAVTTTYPLEPTLVVGGRLDNTGVIDDYSALNASPLGVTIDGGGEVNLIAGAVFSGLAPSVTGGSIVNVNDIISEYTANPFHSRCSITVASFTNESAGVIEVRGVASLQATDFINSGIVEVTNGGDDNGMLGLGGSSVFSNSGTLEALAGGEMGIGGSIRNSGTLLANNADILIAGAVTGKGKATITADGQIEFGAATSSGIDFTGTGGTAVFDLATHVTGKISGFALGDLMDLTDINFGADTSLTYKINVAHTGGTLTVTDGADTAKLTLVGSYTQSSFSIANDGSGGTLISDPSAHTTSIVGVHDHLPMY